MILVVPGISSTPSGSLRRWRHPPARWSRSMAEDFRPRQGAGDGQTLFLAAGHAGAALLDPGVVLVREALDELIGAGQLATRMHSSSLAFSLPQRRLSRMVPENGDLPFFLGVLHGDLVAEDVEIVIPDIHAATLTVPVSLASYRRSELHQIGLPAPLAPTMPSVPPGLDVKGDVVQDRLAGSRACTLAVTRIEAGCCRPDSRTGALAGAGRSSRPELPRYALRKRRTWRS